MRYPTMLLVIAWGVLSLAGCGSDSSEAPGASATPQPSPSGGAPNFQLAGYATLNGGTTGGKGGETVTVSTYSDLQAAASDAKPMVIQISGKISGSTKVRVASNKTIVGVGSSGELDGVELDLAGSSNIIVRNLRIHHVLAAGSDGDAIHIYNTRNVWVDHCELYADSPSIQGNKDLYDGLVDITSDSAFVTVSWCSLHDHWKCILVGSAETDAFDRRTTLHHNHFRNITSRVPSYRFGRGHIYNNYYYDISDSGVNVRMGAVLRVEGNVFENVRDPITALDSFSQGSWDVADNQFINCTRNQPLFSNGTFAPPYAYTADSSSSVAAMVAQWAGVGKIDPLQDLP